MKKSFTRLNIFYLATVLSLSFIIFATPGLSEPVKIKKVAILPLEMNTTQDLSFLQKGLFSMLSSRLADPGKVEVLEKEVIDNALKQHASLVSSGLNQERAGKLGSLLGVDNVLFGSITLFGDSASLDISIIDIKNEKPALKFSRQTKTPGAVITQMDSIATQINLKVYNRKPEQFLSEDYYAKRQEAYQPGQVERGILTNFRSLMTVKDEIIGISSGDVTGDKENEIIVAYKHGIEIFKDNLNGRLKSFKKIEGPHYLDIVGIDAADINKNGIDEIFITRVRRATGDLASLVLEFDNKKFLPKGKNLNWYLCVTGKNDKTTPVLYAQEKGPFGPYSGGQVFTVNYENGHYVQDTVLRVPDNFNVISLVTIKFLADNKPGFLFTDKFGKLVVFNDAGSTQWESDYGFGGSKLFYHFAKKDDHLRETFVEKTDRRGVFFQPGNLVADVNSDGKNEIIAIKNHESADNTFKERRRYKKGSLDILSWSEMGLAPAFVPKKLPGQITGMTISDFNNDGTKEIVVTMIKKKNNFDAKKSVSVILAYDFFIK